ncbi:bifunctional DNA-formamidopyrimidine glycosylase/DNA-(apurinic or apyrimidinic site) lyase [candidate division WWE3 bacterium]|nr:bifunctional DNA-formamidopyrimidine glycosylase/DNA-(apurinic or apyrimidinic site) lyase [candidate division WWE3 bacterium]
MHELPEVLTILKDLKKELEGMTIKKAQVADSYATRPPKKVFEQLLTNRAISSADHVGKAIILKMSGEELYLAFHLAMTGRLLLRKPHTKEDDHLRVKIIFAGGDELRFTDVRKFGYAKIFKSAELEILKRKYGPTPLNKDLNPRSFLNKISQRKMPIKKVLLDQDVISGVGNIYANDALWMSLIHPETPASRINLKAAEVLLKNLREIMKESIIHRGSTLSDYVDLYGNKGNHQNYFRVYQRENRPCLRCKSPIKLKFIGGRSTFFCPSCQKINTDLPLPALPI